MDLPEHDKLRAIKDQSQAIGEFLEWLGEKGIVLADYSIYEHQLSPVIRGHTKLLAEYFDIDLDKLEEEKLAMLEKLRSGN